MSDETTSKAAFECLECGWEVTSLPCPMCGLHNARATVHSKGLKSNPFVQATIMSENHPRRSDTTLEQITAILQRMWDEYNKDENCDQVVLNGLLEEAADLLELQ